MYTPCEFVAPAILESEDFIVIAEYTWPPQVGEVFEAAEAESGDVRDVIMV